MSRLMCLTLCVAAMLIVGAAAAPPQMPQPSGRPTDSYYGAASQVHISTPVAGDVVVAGRDVRIGTLVSGDILAAGWRIAVAGRADDDVRLAGANVVVDAPIEGDLTIAGGEVAVGTGSRVHGRGWMTGGTVRALGIFERDLQVAGETVQIGGEVREGVQVTAQKLEILPTARLLGPLHYRGPNPAVIAHGASVAGPITYDRIAAKEARRARSLMSVSTILFTLHLLLTGLLLLYVFPRPLLAVVDTMRAAPGPSLLTGFALVVGAPLAGFLLVFTVLGLPIGLALLALLVLAVLFGVLATAVCVGEAEVRLLGREGQLSRAHGGVLLAGIATLAVLRAMPGVGALVVPLSVMVGIGALMRWARAQASTAVGV